jgi:hypothetical protein
MRWGYVIGRSEFSHAMVTAIEMGTRIIPYVQKLSGAIFGLRNYGGKDREKTG